MKTKYKYIHFEKGGIGYICFNTKSKDDLGLIEWYAPWRRWVFWPDNSDVILSSDCLDDISHFMNQLPKHP